MITVNDKGIIKVTGRIDSSNAPVFEEDLFRLELKRPVVLDLEGLEYISSAGLRVLLKLKKKYGEVELLNVSNEVYDILDVTGFTDMLNAKRAVKTVDVSGLDIIGCGATGVVYRLDDDKILKLFYPRVTLQEIEYETEAAKKAFKLGVPTAINYGVVKSGDRYGIIYELVNSKTLFSIIGNHPEEHDKYAKMYVDLLNESHDVYGKNDFLPMKPRLMASLQKLKGTVIPEAEFDRDLTLFDKLGDDATFIHGDAHPGNVMIMKDEMIFIDMTAVSTGDPMLDIISLGSMIGLETVIQPADTYKRMYDADPALAYSFWRKVMKLYFGTEDEKELDEKERFIFAVAAFRMMLGVLYIPDRFPGGANLKLREIMDNYFKTA